VPNRRVLAVALVIGAIGLAWQIRGAAAFCPAYWLEFVKTPPVSSPIVFIPIYAIAMICFVPTLPLNLVAGALWGAGLGAALALAGSVSGAMLAFVIGSGRSWTTSCETIRSRAHRTTAAGIYSLRLAGGGIRAAESTLSWSRQFPVRAYLHDTVDVLLVTTVFLIPLTVLFSILGSSVGGVLLDGSVASVRNTLLLTGASVVFVAICAMVLRDRYSIRTKPEM
jgi:hypothetical protein